MVQPLSFVVKMNVLFVCDKNLIDPLPEIPNTIKPEPAIRAALSMADRIFMAFLQ